MKRCETLKEYIEREIAAKEKEAKTIKDRACSLIASEILFGGKNELEKYLALEHEVWLLKRILRDYEVICGSVEND